MGSVVSKRDADRPVRPSGPLGPWRLSLSIVAAAVFTGMPLSRAATTGIDLDTALMRSFVVAFFTWIALSFVNRVLGQAAAAADHDAARRMLDDDSAAPPMSMG
ncbi:MAG: hypothetical protein JWN99_2398 [Ilumatobacteraceae bacterium]|nr:hypothetical protein [Ilumatobacteraceae bacterium]